MSYEKQTWTNGDIITAEKLNHMEDGISEGGVIIPGTLEIIQIKDENYSECQLTLTQESYNYICSLSSWDSVYIHAQMNDDTEGILIHVLHFSEFYADEYGKRLIFSSCYLDDDYFLYVDIPFDVDTLIFEGRTSAFVSTYYYEHSVISISNDGEYITGLTYADNNTIVDDVILPRNNTDSSEQVIQDLTNYMSSQHGEIVFDCNGCLFAVADWTTEGTIILINTPSDKEFKLEFFEDSGTGQFSNVEFTIL